MKTRCYLHRFVAIALLCVAIAPRAHSQTLHVVTSMPDLASITSEIGGDRVVASSIAKGYQDPHFVDSKPSHMILLQKADLFIQMGLDLEIGWVPLLIDGARNSAILPGAKGYLDASKDVPLLEIPVGDPTMLRAQGDLHVYGNPHYWLDPLCGKVIATNVFQALSALRPDSREYFRKNLETFNRTVDERTREWVAKLAPYRDAKIVAFHNSWPYLAERFGLQIHAFIEPKPGIPPTPRHLVDLIHSMEQQSIRVIIIEPYYSRKSAEILADKTGAQIVQLATSVGAESSIKNYFDLFDYNVNLLVKALSQNRP